MRFGLLTLLVTTLAAVEPWQTISTPTISTQAEAVALVKLAYRITAEQQASFYSFSEVQVARVGDEIVLRCDEGTFRLRADDLLEPWPISAEESVAPVTAAEQERVALNVLAGKCSNLPLIPAQVVIAAKKTGGWSIQWGAETHSGFGIQVGGTDPSNRPYMWGARKGSFRCCGHRAVMRPPQGSG